MKSRVAASLQLVLGLLLLGIIGWRLHAGGQWADLQQAFRITLGNWPWLVLAALAFGYCLAICTFRWTLVLRALGFPLPFRRIAALYAIGQFFNAFMLGATGGDLVKAWLVTRGQEGRKTELVASVFIERAVGLLAIVLLAPLAMLTQPALYLSSPATRLLLAAALGMLVLIPTGLFLVFKQNLLARWTGWRRLKPARAVDTLERLYSAAQLVLAHPGLLGRTLLLSALNHLGFVVAAFAVGLALTLPLGFGDYLAVMLTVNLVASLPVTPSGLGTRESAAILLLGAQGVTAPAAVTLSLMLYATMLAWSLVGGVVYLFWRPPGGLDGDQVAGQAIPKPATSAGPDPADADPAHP